MTLSALLIIYSIWCLLRGLAFVFSPVQSWKTFNVNLDKHTSFPVQILGGAFIATAVLSWTTKDLIDISDVESTLVFFFSMEIIQTVVTMYGLLRKAITKHAFIPFLIHLVFSFAFGFFLFGK